MTVSNKIKVVVVILIIAILVVLFLIIFRIISLPAMPQAVPQEKSSVSGEKKEIKVENFILEGVVSKVDAKNNYLIVKSADDGKEIRVDLNKDTKFSKLEVPIDLRTAKKGTLFTLQSTGQSKDVGISDIKTGNNVSIKTTSDITGKTEFDSVDSVQVMP